MNDILRQLNPEQQEAVKTIDGPVLVLAGAGTGKTRVITFRMAYMLRNLVAPENILGMTFTNKAAKEMKERLAALVPEEQARKVTLGTFHAFCARVLRKDIKALGFTSNFTIADESDQSGIVKQAMAELGFSKSENITGEKILYRISNLKNNLIAPSQAKKVTENVIEEITAAVYEKYQELLYNQNMLDFDDMLFFVYKIWTEKPDILKRYQELYKYILVDEYQDTNKAQFEMLKLLTGTGPSQNLCVVGDDDQSIYGWRGAEVENIINFPNLFKNTKIIKLEQNYRSTNKILSSANKVIAVNSSRYEKNLWSDQGEGENLKLIETDSDEAEAAFVADAAYDIVNSDGLQYKDIAVLYRSNHLSRLLEQSFRKNQIPYKLVGGQEFFKRKEIKDAAAYLKILTNHRDDQSLLRILGVPSRGIGDKAVTSMRVLQEKTFKSYLEILADDVFLKELSSKAAAGAREFSSIVKKHSDIFAQSGNLAEKTINYLEEVGYLNGMVKIYKDRKDAEQRQENVYEFINAISAYERKFSGSPYLFEFLESYSLLDENDRTEEDENNGNAVTFTTIHAAKGLEYPYVFIIGMEQNIFPHERSLNERGIEEELRLFYVALTRAKKHLTITRAKSRITRGFNSVQRPSQFLNHLPPDNVDKMNSVNFFKKASQEELMDGFRNIFDILKD